MQDMQLLLTLHFRTLGNQRLLVDSLANLCLLWCRSQIPVLVDCQALSSAKERGSAAC